VPSSLAPSSTAWRYTPTQAARCEMQGTDFDAAWAEGARVSTEEAIAYAQRGRGERKRPTSGWASLTPAAQDVVRLVARAGQQDIAPRLSSRRALCNPTSLTSTPRRG
jgi:hypothetical protein